MSIISLDEAKRHLRIDQDYDDAEIQLKLDAAEQIATEFIQRKVYATQDEINNSKEDRPLLICPMFIAAVMLILGDLYMNREDSASNQIQVSQASQRILEPLRINQGV